MSVNKESRKLIHTKQGLSWLAQFDPLDRNLAASIANVLTLVSHIEFERNVISKIESVALRFPGKVGLFAVREIRDSEGVIHPYYSQVVSHDNQTVNSLSNTSDQGSEARIANFIRQICKSNPDKYLNHPTLSALRDSRCDAIIFVDDFIGSGGRVSDFLHSFWLEPSIVSWLSGKQLSFHVVAYSGLEDGITYVQRLKSQPKVHIYRDAPTFNNIAWSESKKKLAKDLFTKYGRLANKKRKTMWWGYKEGLVSLIFEHGCPNNTPAILWEPNYSGSGWIGLFPNRAITTQVASVFPPEIQRGDPIELLSNVGQIVLAKSGALSRRGEKGLLMLLILAFIAKGQRSRSTISHATGLDVDNVERLIKICIKFGFINSLIRITEKGVAEIKAAKKVKADFLSPVEIGTDYYYPTQLREATND